MVFVGVLVGPSSRLAPVSGTALAGRIHDHWAVPSWLSSCGAALGANETAPEQPLHCFGLLRRSLQSKPSVLPVQETAKCWC
jgi:hypothetical protein